MILQSQISTIRYSKVRLLYITQCYCEYYAIQIQNKKEVKLKIQNSLNSNRVQEEAQNLLLIQDIAGIPEVVDYGFNTNQRFFLATEHLGPTLATLLSQFGVLSRKNVLLIGIKMIRILKRIHSRNLIHNKICPKSIRIGSKTNNCSLYLSDFSLTLQKNTFSSEMVEYDREWNFSSHRMNTLDTADERDDLESLGYLLIYLLIGKLPWNFCGKLITFHEIEQLQQTKLKYIQDDHMFSNLPINFKLWFAHLLSINKGEQPNYLYLKNILINHLKENGYKTNDQLDFASSSGVLFSPKSRTSSKTRSPQSIQKSILSPIVEDDKDLEIGWTLQDKKSCCQKENKGFSQQIQLNENDLQLLNSMEKMKRLISDDDAIDQNSSLIIDDQDECEIWVKLDELSKQSQSVKSITNLLELF